MTKCQEIVDKEIACIFWNPCKNILQKRFSVKEIFSGVYNPTKFRTSKVLTRAFYLCMEQVQQKHSNLELNFAKSLLLVCTISDF